MPYNGSKAHRKALSDALSYLQTRRVSWPQIHEDYSRAFEKGAIPSIDLGSGKAVSRLTLTGYGKYDPRKALRDAESVFNFLEHDPVYQTPYLNFAGVNAGDAQNDARASIIYAMARFFSARQDRSVAHLENLTGVEFAMFKPLRNGLSDELYVRSIVNFKKTGAVDLLEFTETTLIDDHIYLGGTINETYLGFVFQLGTNLLIFSKQDKTSDFKLLVIHEIHPQLDSSKTKADILYGTLLRVSGKGPYVGSKFLLRRIQEKKEFPDNRQVIRKEELDSIAIMYFT